MVKGKVNTFILISSIIISLSILGATYLNNRFRLEIQKQASEQKLQEIRLETEKEKELEKERIINIKNCQKEAYRIYGINWNNNCKSQGLKEDCNLPLPLSQPLEESLQKEEENCIKIYSTNSK